MRIRHKEHFSIVITSGSKSTLRPGELHHRPHPTAEFYRI
jgi:hypothetical protein